MNHRPRLSKAQVERAKRLCDLGHSYSAIALILHVDRSSIARAKRRGWKPYETLTRPIPGDFGLYACDESIAKLQVRYGCGQAQIYEWIRLSPVKRKSLSGRNKTERPCPVSFRLRGRDVPRVEAARLWKASRPIITRWRKECGFPTPRADLLADRKARQNRSTWLNRYFEERQAA